MSTTVTKQIRLEFEPLLLPLANPWKISHGTTRGHTKNILVKLIYEDFVGLGEAAPTFYHGENFETASALLAWLQVNNLLGDDPFSISLVHQKLDKAISGHASVKAAIDMAMHDLVGQIIKQPVNKYLGLHGLEQPITDFTIGLDTLAVIEEKTKHALAIGYKVFKIKQGTSYDRDIIKTIRKIAPTTPLRVDANGAWTVKHALEMSKFLAEHNVQFIEQPLPKSASIEDYRLLRESSPLPIFIDESVSRAEDVARFAGAVDGVVLKLVKSGGIQEALRFIHAARAHCLQIMIGCMVESSISITAAAHVSGLVDYLDLDGALLLSEDPYEGARYEDGYLLLPDRPGLGVRPKRSKNA